MEARVPLMPPQNHASKLTYVAPHGKEKLGLEIGDCASLPWCHPFCAWLTHGAPSLPEYSGKARVGPCRNAQLLHDRKCASVHVAGATRCTETVNRVKRKITTEIAIVTGIR